MVSSCSFLHIWRLLCSPLSDFSSIPTCPDRDFHLSACQHSTFSSWFLWAITVCKRNYQYTIFSASYCTVPTALLGSIWVKYISSAFSLKSNGVKKEDKSLAFSPKYQQLLFIPCIYWTKKFAQKFWVSYNLMASCYGAFLLQPDSQIVT